MTEACTMHVPTGGVIEKEEGTARIAAMRGCGALRDGLHPHRYDSRIVGWPHYLYSSESIEVWPVVARKIGECAVPQGVCQTGQAVVQRRVQLRRLRAHSLD